MGRVPFNTFISDMGEVIECLFIKFSNGTKLGEGNTFKDGAAIQRDQGWVNGVNKNLMKFNQDMHMSHAQSHSHEKEEILAAI